MNIESDILTAIGWAEEFFRTPRERIDLDGMAAVAELASDFKKFLSTPLNQSRLARIGKMVAQDMPSLTAAPAAPKAPEPIAPPQEAGAHGSSIYTGPNAIK